MDTNSPPLTLTATCIHGIFGAIQASYQCIIGHQAFISPTANDIYWLDAPVFLDTTKRLDLSIWSSHVQNEDIYSHLMTVYGICPKLHLVTHMTHHGYMGTLTQRLNDMALHMTIGKTAQ